MMMNQTLQVIVVYLKVKIRGDIKDYSHYWTINIKWSRQPASHFKFPLWLHTQTHLWPDPRPEHLFLDFSSSCCCQSVQMGSVCLHLSMSWRRWWWLSLFLYFLPAAVSRSTSIRLAWSLLSVCVCVSNVSLLMYYRLPCSDIHLVTVCYLYTWLKLQFLRHHSEFISQAESQKWQEQEINGSDVLKKEVNKPTIN